MAKAITVDDFEPKAEEVAYGATATVDLGSKEPPKYGTREWHDYIMSLLVEDELFEGYPKVDGLRRVTQEHVGDILLSRPATHDTPRMENGFRYVVSHEVIINFYHDGVQRVFSELADVDMKGVNTPQEFSIHPSSTASSRAEGRALRKALKLRTLAAEELAPQSDEKEEDGMDFLIDDEPTEITTTQQTFIEHKCDKLGISVKKLLAKSKAGYKNLSDLSFKDAAKTIEYLNDIQTNKKDVPLSIAKE